MVCSVELRIEIEIKLGKYELTSSLGPGGCGCIRRGDDWERKYFNGILDFWFGANLGEPLPFGDVERPSSGIESVNEKRLKKRCN